MEMLLCYEDEGVYVNTYGRIIKDVVLQWGEMPTSVGTVQTFTVGTGIMSSYEDILQSGFSTHFMCSKIIFFYLKIEFNNNWTGSEVSSWSICRFYSYDTIVQCFPTVFEPRHTYIYIYIVRKNPTKQSHQNYM